MWVYVFFFHGASSTFSLKHHSHHEKTHLKYQEKLWWLNTSIHENPTEIHQDLGISKNRGKPPKMDGL